MVDNTIEEDDVIIDLTDLLEEGESFKKDAENLDIFQHTRTKNEPDTFDLGKEISMEDDVQADDIDNADERLDIDAFLSSNEEDALAEEKPLDFSSSLFEEDLKETDLSDSPAEVETEEAETDFTDIFEQENLDLSGDIETEELPEDSIGFAEELIHTEKAGAFDQVSVQNYASEPQKDAALDGLHQEIPAMLEDVARPLIAEL
ncbi:MAG: hypothetical protein JW920_03350, partial [Deltaproteobacteria bacterium]|nr:hypothetical protein [Deltaproteobacteria bacterium]